MLGVLLLKASPGQGLSPSRKPFMSTPQTISGSSVVSSSTAAGANDVPSYRDLPPWAQLPSKPDFKNMDLSLRAEIWIGRLAMAGAIGLVVTELGTGESFIDQFNLLVNGAALQ